MNKVLQEQLRSLPGVDDVLKFDTALVGRYGRSAVLEGIRDALGSLREAIRSGGKPAPGGGSAEEVLARAEAFIQRALCPRLRSVVNATGIILHTGLGRAVMPDEARAAVSELTGCCNIQIDLETGGRMKREGCIRDLVRDLTGAEEALVVNNNAGATMLVLKALAEGREVIVSRGELIEIGGSFRLPDIMAQSGAVLREVGATNKTHLRDYEQAVSERTGALLKAHKSNYAVVGFTKEVSIAEIAETGHRHGIPVVDDMGCGALVALEVFGLDHEMTMRESLEAGADVVLSSTDKLIGGPQGGLILGRKDLLDCIRAHPLYRALRVGKMTLAALEATLRLFKTPELLVTRHPLYRMLAREPGEMRQQAEALADRIAAGCPRWQVSITEEKSYLGGGSLPGSDMPSVAVRLSSGDEPPGTLAGRLRSASVPVVPHVRDDAVLLNMRTVPAQDCTSVYEACLESAEQA